MGNRPQDHPHKGVTDDKTAGKSNSQQKAPAFGLGR